MNSDKNYPTSPLYQKYFGSWNNALREANLETKYIFRKWTKKEIISSVTENKITLVLDKKYRLNI